jgi:hypothetical protein
MEFYPNAGKGIPKDLPPEKGPRVRMTDYVDAEHVHDLVTRRSIIGILVMLNNTPIRWISKPQKTMRHQLMAQNWWLLGLLYRLSRPYLHKYQASHDRSKILARDLSSIIQWQ